MSEALSDSTRHHIEYGLTSWLRRFERDLDNILPLDQQETDALLRFIYGDKYEAMKALETTPYLPRSILGCFINASWSSPLQYQGLIRIKISATQNKLPAMFGFNNDLRMIRDIGDFAPLFGGLPLRYQQAIQELARVAEALTDLQSCMKEYSRARWLLYQWPGAFVFLPDHTKQSLKARAFKRPPPKTTRRLKPETLETLAWLCLVYPISESRP